jgi:hypothetical protein
MYLAVEKPNWSYIILWNFKKWFFFFIQPPQWAFSFQMEHDITLLIQVSVFQIPFWITNLVAWLASYCHSIVSMTLDKLTIFLKQPWSGPWHLSVFWSLCISCFKQQFILMMMMNAASFDFVFIFWWEILHSCKVLKYLTSFLWIYILNKKQQGLDIKLFLEKKHWLIFKVLVLINLEWLIIKRGSHKLIMIFIKKIKPWYLNRCLFTKTLLVQILHIYI